MSDLYLKKIHLFTRLKKIMENNHARYILIDIRNIRKWLPLPGMFLPLQCETR